MASEAENRAGLQQLTTGNNPSYATIKARYPGSWMEDVTALSTRLGVPVNNIIAKNPWLQDNNFVANNNDYAVLLLTGSNPGGTGSNVASGNQNQLMNGYYATNNWVFPLGVGTWYVSQGYKSSHTGLDLTTGTPGKIKGAPIYASKAGTIVQSYESTSWGFTILIRHDDTIDESGNCYYTRYAHMEALPTQKVGDKVSQGDKLGTVGNTGKSTGYHLHYHIYWTSATRTDYANFNGSATFGVDPNTIEDYPGKPWTENNYSTVEYTKSPLVTDEMMETIQKAVRGDATMNEINGLKEALVTAIANDQNIDLTSTLGGFLRDFVDAQLDSIIENGYSSALQLLQGGDFQNVWNNFAQTVVDNAIYYVQNKINIVINQAIAGVIAIGDAAVVQAKSDLKNWIFEVTKLDPNSNTAQQLGTYLDGYVDGIINNGWSAVTTLISTGDVKTAVNVFLEETKDFSIDYMCNVFTHGVTTAIVSYMPQHINDPDLANIATSLAIGCTNTLINSVGQVLKGDISLEQAAKNVVVSLVSSAVSVGISYVAPIVSTTVTNWIIAGLEGIGVAVGGVAGGIIGGAVGVVINTVFNWVGNKLLGWLF